MAASSGRLQSAEAAPVILREGRVTVAERGLGRHELLKRRDFVPQLLAPLTWCLHKVYNNQKKEKNIQNTERSGDVDVRNQAGIEASLLCIQTGFTCEQNNLGYLHHRLISCWFRIAPLAVLWTLCCRWCRCLEPL